MVGVAQLCSMVYFLSVDLVYETNGEKRLSVNRLDGPVLNT